jgi:hypothetical protein
MVMPKDEMTVSLNLVNECNEAVADATGEKVLRFHDCELLKYAGYDLPEDRVYIVCSDEAGDDDQVDLKIDNAEDYNDPARSDKDDEVIYYSAPKVKDARKVLDWLTTHPIANDEHPYMVIKDEFSNGDVIIGESDNDNNRDRSTVIDAINGILDYVNFKMNWNMN